MCTGPSASPQRRGAREQKKTNTKAGQGHSRKNTGHNPDRDAYPARPTGAETWEKLWLWVWVSREGGRVAGAFEPPVTFTDRDRGCGAWTSRSRAVRWHRPCLLLRTCIPAHAASQALNHMTISSTTNRFHSAMITLLARAAMAPPRARVSASGRERGSAARPDSQAQLASQRRASEGSRAGVGSGRVRPKRAVERVARGAARPQAAGRRRRTGTILGSQGV